MNVDYLKNLMKRMKVSNKNIRLQQQNASVELIGILLDWKKTMAFYDKLSDGLGSCDKVGSLLQYLKQKPIW